MKIFDREWEAFERMKKDLDMKVVRDVLEEPDWSYMFNLITLSKISDKMILEMFDMKEYDVSDAQWLFKSRRR